VHRGASLDLDDFSMAKGFSPYGAYAASKLANLLFTGRLVREPAFEGILCFGLHPGVIGTKLLRQNFGVGGASLESGAKTSVLCATGEGLEGHQGGYFSDARPQEASAESLDLKKQDKLWERSMGLLRPYLKAAA
jgi:NAD(P)-dependent dehydrogenase (short-subunit alcohol dehydrogenase family)